MNNVLLIACVGPMQSWGTRSRFQERDTEREPSKSAVIGMLCAALGRDRELPVDDLASLRMGVRVDREGILRKDFQTAQNVAVASGGSPQDLLSNRYYLADAAFLVGLEGNIQLLEKLHSSLSKPAWQIFLGRKSYLPSTAPFLKDGLIKGMDIRSAFAEYPLLMSSKEIEVRKKKVEEGRGDGRIRLILESDSPTYESRRDQPISFALGRRMFRDRYVATEYLDISSWAGKGEL